MLHEANFGILDIETGGFKPEENPIMQIAIQFRNAEYKVIEEFQSLVIPYDDLKILDSAVNYHKIHPETCYRDGKDILEILNALKDLFKKYKIGRSKKVILVGHNAARFDVPFLNYLFEMKLKESIFKYCEEAIEDTQQYSRLKWGLIEVSGHTLSEVAERFGIDITAAHDAFGDVEVTAKVYEQFLNLIRIGTTSENGENLNYSRDDLKFQF